MKSNILKLAREEANLSKSKFRMGAVIFCKKTIISKGKNNSSRSVKHLLPRFFKWPYSVHAEVDAIIKARQNVMGASMLVIRINKNNELLSSFSCEKCLTYIDYVGIKEIYYVNHFGKIKRMKL